MTEQPAFLRRAGHNQMVITVPRFLEYLVDYNAVPKPHLGGDTEPFELSFLLAQICSKFRFGLEQLIDIFFESYQVGINRRWLGHDVQQRHGSPDCRSHLAGELYRSLDEF